MQDTSPDVTVSRVESNNLLSLYFLQSVICGWLDLFIVHNNHKQWDHNSSVECDNNLSHETGP